MESSASYNILNALGIEKHCDPSIVSRRSKGILIFVRTLEMSSPPQSLRLRPWLVANDGILQR